MKVAVVCPYAWDRVGGVQSHVRSLAQALSGRGHEAMILAPCSRRRAESTNDRQVALVGRAVPVPANGSVAPVAFGPVAAAGVRKTLEMFRPDVLHLHEPLIPSLSLLALWNAHCPMVGTFHASAESSVGYRVSRPVLARAIQRLAARTAVSDAARAFIARYFPGDYVLTPNGIDAARFRAAAPADLGPGRKVLFLSRVERRKGLEVLIQAMTRLRELDVELVVAGSGPQEDACRALARHLKVPARWLGRVPDDDVPRLFRAADVYCAPALGGESFGIVLVEAMAAGAPVVCSGLQSFRSVAGGAAELVPPGQAGPLADALRRVLTDDARAERMRKASVRMSQPFDWGRLVAGVESVYARALSRAGASGR